MNKTKIEWVKNPDGSQGYTWNPITGCLNGCEYCYARKLANGRLRQRYLANKNWDTRTPEGYDDYPNLDPFYPRFWEERLSEPIGFPTSHKPVKQKGIFTCDMSDLFGIGIPKIWTDQIMTTIKLCPYHCFYLLTKQPQNLFQFSPFPENCWVGISVTKGLRSEWLDFAHVRAGKTFVSFEPLLAPATNYLHLIHNLGIDWVIIGQQTPVSAKTQPRIEWVREIVEAADRAGIPVFLKDNLKPLLQPLMRVPNLSWFGNVFGLRQEMPKVK